MTVPTPNVHRTLLAIGPFVILGGAIVLLFVAFPFDEIETLAGADPLAILWLVTVVGAIAGIVPVTIGMLWYPFLRTLSTRWIDAVLALSAGVLSFAGMEMVFGIIDNTAHAPVRGGLIAIGGMVVAFGILIFVREWRSRALTQGEQASGLQAAYIIAFGLGLHSIGEGLAIGTAFMQGDGRLVALLVVAFLLDNVTEGPTIVAAIAREVESPRLHHFILLGVIAGSPVIIGGWIGSLATTALIAALFFAIGLGAILEVIWEVIRFIGANNGGRVTAAFSPLNLGTYVIGFLIMVVIDAVVIDMFLL